MHGKAVRPEVRERRRLATIRSHEQVRRVDREHRPGLAVIGARPNSSKTPDQPTVRGAESKLEPALREETAGACPPDEVLTTRREMFAGPDSGHPEIRGGA